MRNNLQNNLAVVTGASSGIGEQYARRLAADGADLVLVARRGDRLRKLARELSEAHGSQVEVIEADLAQAGSARAVFDAATADGRPITLLINNAGVGPYGHFLGRPVDTHSSTIDLNVRALTELCHLFATHMLEHGKRSYITNIGSVIAFQGSSNFAVYAGTKAFVRVFSEILARELQGSAISVTCVCPGGTLTEFSEVAGQKLTTSAQPMMMAADEVVRIGLRAMIRGSTLVVPGLINKLACVAPRLLPRSLALTLADLTLRRMVVETRRGGAPDA